MKNKKYKKTISKKTAFGLTLLGLFMIICVAACVAFIYQNQLDRNYKSLTKSYGKSASDFIDGDYVEKIVKTPDKDRGKFFDDKYYKEVKKFLDTVEKDSDIKYYYVFEPRDKYLKYLWDSDTIEQASDLTTSDENYMTDGKAFSQKAFKKNPKIDIRYFDDEEYGKIVSSFYPIYNSKGDPVALVGVDISTPYIIERLLHFIIAVILAVIVVTLIAEIAWFRYMKKGLIIPLHTLNDASKNMVANLEEDSKVEININTHDEIEELADSFTYMNTEIRDYINQVEGLTAEKERIGAELDIARDIQTGMLPSTFPPFPDHKDFDLYASMDAAKEVGGDFYDYFLLDDDHLGLVIADVSGKGVPAALTMMSTKILIANTAKTYPTAPAKVLEEVNKQIADNNNADMFVTAWFGILELSSGNLTCANAGHEYPVICREGKKYELFKDKHGLVLGGMSESKYTEYTIKLDKGDVLYVYTDGVPEATDKDLNQMGMEYMIDALNGINSTNPEAVISEMHNAIDDFIKGAEQFDDITMLCIRYQG
ncbi:MAG: SpoIIE family protein phosphatase [Eubacterium sp.]|nr:SpoIIE family protein phosphatase [Eubacterium sp.]